MGRNAAGGALGLDALGPLQVVTVEGPAIGQRDGHQGKPPAFLGHAHLKSLSALASKFSRHRLIGQGSRCHRRRRLSSLQDT